MPLNFLLSSFVEQQRQRGCRQLHRVTSGGGWLMWGARWHSLMDFHHLRGHWHSIFPQADAIRAKLLWRSWGKQGQEATFVSIQTTSEIIWFCTSNFTLGCSHWDARRYKTWLRTEIFMREEHVIIFYSVRCNLLKPWLMCRGSYIINVYPFC